MMKTNKTAKNKRNNEKGVTLIEICIAMLVIGLIMTPLLWVYNVERKSEEINTTVGYFNAIEDALASYVNVYDRYPLPASLILTEGDVNYGKAFDLEGDGDMPNACPAALTTQGVCMITQRKDGSALPLDEQLIVGMVPFADIQVEEEQAYDIWGQRIIYVVTARQTQDAITTSFLGGSFQRAGAGRVKFTALNGWTGAQVTTGSLIGDNELIAEPGLGIAEGYTNHDALLFSTGPLGKGGFTAAGVRVGVCAEPGNPEFEDENCDFTDNIFMIDNNPRFDPRTQAGGGTYNNISPSATANGTRSLAAGPTFYDDLTHEIPEIGAAIWNENFTDPTSIVTSANRLGVGVQAPETVLHVGGDLRAEDDPGTGALEGRIVSNQIADAGASNIMQPRLIGGQEPDMNCYEKNSAFRVRPVAGIGFGQTFCAQPADTGGNGILGQNAGGTGFPPFRLVYDDGTSVINTANGDCDDLSTPLVPYRMIGIDAAGDVICAPTNP